MKHLLFAFILISNFGFSQIGTQDFSFAPNDFGDMYSVTCMAHLSNGQILAGGLMSSNISPIMEHEFIKRYNADGTVDAAFNTPRFSKTIIGTSTFGVTDLAIDEFDRIYAVGYFDSVHTGSMAGNILRRGIVRFYSNGLIDPSFNPATNNYHVQTIEIQPDGKILVGGSFSNFGGAPNSTVITRLNDDGSVDNSFTSNFSTSGGSGVWGIEYTSDDKILAVGTFTSYDGQSASRIVRMESNGTFDPSFNIGVGFENAAQFIEELEDGSYFTGGFFTSYNDTTTSNCIRLNPDGTIMYSFNNAQLNGGSSSYNVTDFTRDPDGNFYCVGSFLNYQFPYGGSSINLVRFDETGVLDTMYTNYALLNALTNCIEYTDDNQLLLGGIINEYNSNSNLDKLIRINLDCAQNASISESPQFTLYSLGYQVHANIQPSYQWLDCTTGDTISGANQNTFTATANNQYSMIIADTYCVDTLDCYQIQGVGLPEMNTYFQIKVYPNPNSGTFVVSLESSGLGQLVDQSGRLVERFEVDSPSGMDKTFTNVSSGFYVLNFTTGKHTSSTKIIVQ